VDVCEVRRLISAGLLPLLLHLAATVAWLGLNCKYFCLSLQLKPPLPLPSHTCRNGPSYGVVTISPGDPWIAVAPNATLFTIGITGYISYGAGYTIVARSSLVPESLVPGVPSSPYTVVRWSSFIVALHVSIPHMRAHLLPFALTMQPIGQTRWFSIGVDDTDSDLIVVV
jgi:hypothetical protein